MLNQHGHHHSAQKCSGDTKVGEAMDSTTGGQRKPQRSTKQVFVEGVRVHLLDKGGSFIASKRREAQNLCVLVKSKLFGMA